MSSDLSARVVKVSKVLGIPQKTILKALDEAGISNDTEGLFILNSPTTSVPDLESILSDCADKIIKPLKLKAAAALLKDGDKERDLDPVAKQEVPEVLEKKLDTMVDVAEALKSFRPIQQWCDRELLEKFALDRDSEIEQELHKRSFGRNIIILKQGKNEPGKEEIDISNSLELLKMARKRVTPTIIPVGNEGVVSPVYPILRLNIQDRIVEHCPLCSETLYMGFCEKCNVRFTDIGDDERAFIHLIASSDQFDVNSFSDKKAVIASASKGIVDLRLTWPSLSQKFDELKITGDLPKLKFISSRPTNVQDPFFVGGNRSMGNKSF